MIPHAKQPVQRAGKLMAMDEAKLAETRRAVKPVAPQPPETPFEDDALEDDALGALPPGSLDVPVDQVPSDL